MVAVTARCESRDCNKLGEVCVMGELVKISRVLERGDGNQLFFECPGCKILHGINVGLGSGPRWWWNGDAEKPTFTPSIKTHYPYGIGKEIICHSYVTDGVIQFLGDCTHELAGKSVPMIDIDSQGDA